MNNQKTNLRQVKTERQNSVFFMPDPLGFGNCLPSRGGNMYSWKYVLAVIGFTILATFIYVETAKAEIINTASYYTVKSCLREGTSGIMANGKKLEDRNVLTAAMWGVPFGTRVLVRNLTNNKSCVVVITDRGPAKRLVRKGRIIDLNYEAMYRLDGISQGVIPCKVEEVK